MASQWATNFGSCFQSCHRSERTIQVCLFELGLQYSAYPLIVQCSSHCFAGWE